MRKNMARYDDKRWLKLFSIGALVFACLLVVAEAGRSNGKLNINKQQQQQQHKHMKYMKHNILVKQHMECTFCKYVHCLEQTS